ncbi:MAG: NPCBM/NEW2 domain-containing protein [Candidatus Omnitrophica bacterium]|nr:NPCBM/NEW2 domain-containing protein [Candidatus Omnitrophota bacterium]
MKLQNLFFAGALALGLSPFATQAGPITKTYLTELIPANVTGALVKDRSADQTPLNIGFIPFERGLGVRADSDVVYDVQGRGGRFEAWAGFDVSSEECSAVFQVYADGTLVYDSGIVQYHAYQRSSCNPPRPMKVTLDLAGIKSLRLTVKKTDGGDAKCDADWGDAALVPVGSAEPVASQSTVRPAALPPMGWTSWNCFGPNINEKVILEIVDAMVATGMKDAGYEYVNLDDGWQDDPTVNADGLPLFNKEKFPHGMRYIADYVHSRGLKFGIYSRPAWVNGHETETAKTFASWGIDFIKYDFSDRTTNEKMMSALQATHRPVAYCACEWGSDKPWEWAGPMGAAMWRISYDVVDKWYSGADRNTGLGVLDAAHQAEFLCSVPQPGWSDPDMLVVGLNGGGHVAGGATPDECRTQFSLWCMLCAPLLAGNDLRHMDAFTRETLLNRNMIAIQKDPLMTPASRVKTMRQFEIWKKPMKNGDVIVAILNLSDAENAFKVHFRDVQLKGSYNVRDVWADEAIGNYDRAFTVDVRCHETKVLRFAKTKP